MKIKFLLKWLLAILIFAVSFAVVYWYFTTYVQSNKTDTKHIVGRKNIEDVLTVYGSVMSDSDRALSFQTNGIVKKIIKKEGDDVSNGEIIAYLNMHDLNFDLLLSLIPKYFSIHCSSQYCFFQIRFNAFYI